jgi:hypothetical protein
MKEVGGRVGRAAVRCVSHCAYSVVHNERIRSISYAVQCEMFTLIIIMQ